MDKEMYLRISRPQNTCVSCGAEIAVEGKHASVLLPESEEVEAESEHSPVRRDYCANCWGKAQDKDYFSFWVTRREKPKPKKLQNRKERNAAVLSYFEHLRGKNDPEFVQHLFFLAHLLMKYGVLRWVRSEPPAEPDGAEKVIFRNTATDDLIPIESVPLEDERIAQIKKEIDEYISQHVSEAPQEPAS